MPAPTAVAEKYIPLASAVFTVGTGTPVTMDAMDGTLTHTMETDEMTNSTSGGWFEDVGTINKMEGDVTLAYPAAGGPGLIAGSVYAVSISVASGPTITGNMRFNAIGRPMLNVKGGLKQTYKLTSQGQMTITLP